jgi:hypothetical protein
MASHVVPSGHIGAHAKTLVAATADTVTYELGTVGALGWNRMPQAIEILTDGVADIYVTTDGTAPTVGGSHCWRVPAVAGASRIDLGDQQAVNTPVVVKLISAGTPTYSVSRG